MSILEPIEEKEYPKEVFDFNSPEHVLISVIDDEDADLTLPIWKKHTIEVCAIIWSENDNVTGAASYENSYGGFLDYTIEGMIDCPGPGWFVVENVTGYYYKGDGWHTDDDMDFYYTNVRRATPEEILLA